MKNLSRFLFVLTACVLALGSALSEAADNIQCQTPIWTQEPRMDDGRFKGELTVDCILTNTLGGGLVSLEKDLVSGVENSSQVHSGPVSSSWEGMASRRYDVTQVVLDDEGEEQLSIRAWIDIASQPDSRVAYVSRSQAIKGKGNAGFLRKLDVTLDVQRDASQERTYGVRLVNAIEIKRPWYAPEEIFFDQAQKSTREQFEDRMNETLPQVWNQL